MSLFRPTACGRHRTLRKNFPEYVLQQRGLSVDITSTMALPELFTGIAGFLAGLPSIESPA